MYANNGVAAAKTWKLGLAGGVSMKGNLSQRLERALIIYTIGKKSSFFSVLYSLCPVALLPSHYSSAACC